MKKIIIKIILYLLLIISATLLWWQVGEIILTTSKSESWVYPTLFFSLFFILWAITTILVRNKWEIFGITTVALASSFLWIDNTMQIGIFLVASVALLLAIAVVKEEISLRIKFSAWNSLRTGRRFFIFGLALIISGQYYFGTLSSENEKVVPKIQISQQQTNWALDIVAKINPQLGLDKNKEATVDNFIEQQILTQAGIGGLATSDLTKKSLAIKEGREQLSKMIGRDVAGDEKIAEVLSEMMNEKINKVLNVDVGYVDESIPLTHWLLTGVTFLLVSSVGAFVSVILILIIKLLFMIMLTVKIVNIEKIDAILERMRIK